MRTWNKYKHTYLRTRDWTTLTHTHARTCTNCGLPCVHWGSAEQLQQQRRGSSRKRRETTAITTKVTTKRVLRVKEESEASSTATEERRIIISFSITESELATHTHRDRQRERHRTMTLPTNTNAANGGNGSDDDSDMFGPPRCSPPIGYHHHRSRVPMISPKLRQREERKRILQLCAHKLERIKDSEANLRRSVCINNTYCRLTDELRREKQLRYVQNMPKWVEHHLHTYMYLWMCVCVYIMCMHVCVCLLSLSLSVREPHARRQSLIIRLPFKMVRGLIWHFCVAAVRREIKWMGEGVGRGVL